MKRRGFLAVAAGSVLAGCSAGATDGKRETTDRSAETGANSPANRLRIQSGADREYDLSLRLEKLQTGTVVYEQVRTLGPGDSVNLDSELSSSDDFRFVVRWNGQKLLNLSIHPHEGYVLTVRSGPSVEITEQLEV